MPKSSKSKYFMVHPREKEEKDRPKKPSGTVNTVIVYRHIS